MKKTGFWILMIAIFVACASQKGLVDIKKNQPQEEEKDSIEYELLTFDSRFETWYMFQNSPARYRSKEYYETWNRQYVVEWNIKAMHGGRNNFFETIIGYEPTVDYGFELNHKLFYYFQYVEKVLHIQILTNGPMVPLI